MRGVQLCRSERCLIVSPSEYFDKILAEKRETIERLTREVEALRKLPVIRLCEDCAYQQYARCDHVDGPSPSPVFTAKMAKSTPPEWCPLRGGANEAVDADP